MSQLAFDLDIEVDDWSPVWEKSVTDFGWHMGESATALHDDDTPVSKDEWKRYINSGRCRDCGTVCAFNQGGADRAGSFRICDACSLLDGAHVVEHRSKKCEPREIWNNMIVAECLDCSWYEQAERFVRDGTMEREPVPAEEVESAIAEHHVARYAARWGTQHEIADHEGLLQAQAKRRSLYLRDRKKE